ncbi:MAG: NYN domain-containing protein [Lachnospiraceae bacterium]|nr:NYN domain-containing protein [Lachnospiraceae bacterium]
MIRTAILVDGAFYRKRAYYFYGDVSPKKRADELEHYCKRHIKDERNDVCQLYRVFYYDCPPMDTMVYHPLLKKQIDFSSTDIYKWSDDFFKELIHKRKFALRRGRLAVEQAQYIIRQKTMRKLLSGAMQIEELSERDFVLDVKQKGVDMRIGVDISSLTYKRQVDRIILISGDSDFVPAAKQARREGIDFILDPMRNPIKDDLYEHIDGMRTKVPQHPISLQGNDTPEGEA